MYLLYQHSPYNKQANVHVYVRGASSFFPHVAVLKLFFFFTLIYPKFIGILCLKYRFKVPCRFWFIGSVAVPGIWIFKNYLPPTQVMLMQLSQDHHETLPAHKKAGLFVRRNLYNFCEILVDGNL